jgi:beta-glucuronidase
MRYFDAHIRRQVETLDGVWDFAFLGDVNPAEIDLSIIIFADRMAVPGCFDATPKYAGQRGLTAYRTMITIVDPVPYRLVFNSVHHWCRIFINGKKLCDHAGGFTRFNVDLPVQEADEVELIVLVDNRFDAERCPLHMPHFDWYQFGGISRSVELHRLGDMWIEALQAVTEWIDPPALRVTVRCQALAAGPTNLLISVDGQVKVHEIIALELGVGKIERLIELPEASLWSPEEPNLHLLEVRLGNDDFRTRIGLRQVKVSGRQILINERPVHFLGFNRHEAHPEFGHALPDQVIVSDVQQLRDMGCNFVRGSHYPQDERFLELCDEAGICVWDEVTGWQQTAQHLTNERFISAQSANLEEMVSMAQLHPSVIFYGILNESDSQDPASRRTYARLLGQLRELDPTRLVTFATHHVFEDLCLDMADIISVNCYPGWYQSEIEDIPGYLDQVTQHLDAIGSGNKPVILSEIGAAAVPGWRDWNEERWSEQYQARLLEKVIRHLFIDRDRFAGLSIWQFCDMRTGGGLPRILTRARGYNNKGVLDEYRRPKMAYEVVQKLFHKILKY